MVRKGSPRAGESLKLRAKFHPAASTLVAAVPSPHRVEDDFAAMTQTEQVAYARLVPETSSAGPRCDSPPDRCVFVGTKGLLCMCRTGHNNVQPKQRHIPCNFTCTTAS